MKSLFSTILLATILSVSLAAVQISNSDRWKADWRFGSELSSDSLWILPTFTGDACVASNVTIEDLDCDDSGSCNTTLLVSKYKAWSLTLDEASFVKAIGIVNRRLALSGSLFIYSDSFNSSAPCENLLFASHEGSLSWKNGLNFEYAQWLESGTYWFVISASHIPDEDDGDDDSSDLFKPSDDDFAVLHIWTADLEGELEVSNTSLSWSIPAASLTTEEANVTCSLLGGVEAKPTFFVSSFFIDSDGSDSTGNNTSGVWDITAYLQGINTTLILDQPVIALYKGDIEAFLLEETSGNVTDLLFDPCLDFANFTLIAVVHGGLNDLTTKLTTKLIPGETYSIIVSGMDAADEGHVGIFVVPSVLENILVSEVNTTLFVPSVFTEVEGNTTLTRCNTTGDVTSLWDSFSFTAEADFVLISAYSDFFQPWVAVYSGVPSWIGSDSDELPVTCDDLLVVANANETGVIVVESLTIGETYTLIVSPFNSWLNTTDFVVPEKGDYFLYVLSGSESGVAPTLDKPTDEGLQTDVDVEVNSSNELAIGVALLASLFLMTFVF